MQKIEINKDDLIVKELWFHKRNLMQTASGYGKNLATQYMMKYNNRLHRVYICIFSNNGTTFIRTKDNKFLVVDIY